jgi:hypothetical protein
VETTPGVCQNSFSAPQKHPIANVAISLPSGYGGWIREPLMKCVSAVGMGCSRPGSASRASGMVVGLPNPNMPQVYA